MKIWEEIKESFRRGSSLTRIIYINLGVFIVIRLTYTLYALFSGNLLGGPAIRQSFDHNVMEYLMLPANPATLLFRPWTLISYMFLHFDFLHILFNLLWFYWFGRVFLMYLDQKKLLNVYLLGGLAGAFLFVLAYAFIPALVPFSGASWALGASAAVMAVAITISFLVPDYTFYLIFIGPVRIKYIALFFILTDLIFIPVDGNPGGHIAHLGGAFYGIMYAWQYKKGKDLGRGFSRFMDTVFSFLASPFRRKSKVHVAYKRTEDDMEYNRRKADEQAEIDRILDKISKGGYESLTREEKEKLFRMGK
jgi:membrane associated rhomboid family serine protease